METKERNLSQEFEALLNGRDYRKLIGEEAAKAVVLLDEIVKTKPLQDMTKIEVTALVEELVECLMIILDAYDEKEALQKIKEDPANDWDWSIESILDDYLYGIEAWDNLTAEEMSVVARTILHYLEGDDDWYEWFEYYVEEYLQDEEDKDGK
jgi:hypothetical protein